MNKPIRIIIADDHKMVREGLKAFISPIPYMQVVGEAANGADVVEMAVRLHPDVILLDLLMPKMDGIEATRRIVDRNPDAHILVITSYAEDEKVLAAIHAGASGYLLKDSSPEELKEAIEVLSHGESYLPPGIARKVLREMNRPSQPDEPLPSLSRREIDVLALVTKGYSNEEIARDLFISVWTVRSHLGRIMKKIQVENRTQAALYAIRSGLVNVDH
jgi:DNA-binding NarL/FixJ family response regulator